MAEVSDGKLRGELHHVPSHSWIQRVDDFHQPACFLAVLGLPPVFEQSRFVAAGGRYVRKYHSGSLVECARSEDVGEDGDCGIGYCGFVRYSLFEVNAAVRRLVSIFRMKSVAAQEHSDFAAFTPLDAQPFRDMGAVDGHSCADVVEIVDIYRKSARLADGVLELPFLEV